MKYVIVSVLDAAVQAFGRPVMVQSVGQAVRGFTDEVNRASQDNQMNKHPQDFSLYEVGSFEDESGEVCALPQPRLLVRGNEVVQQGF